MSFVMPEVVLQKTIQQGLNRLRENETAFKCIFDTFTDPLLSYDYGAEYVNEIWNWFVATKIPVVQAWSFNVERVPAFSIHLAAEAEDEGKVAINDYFGTMDDADATTGVSVLSSRLDIGISASKDGDQVLWMYYILSYILLRDKPSLRAAGLQLSTYSASDYNRESKYFADNVFTRWIQFRCTIQNTWDHDPLSTIDDVIIDPDLTFGIQGE